MIPVTVAVCTYNRAQRLPGLVRALRGQRCELPFEILIVDNNSTDSTQSVLADLQNQAGAALRVVSEGTQGIVPARNRAIDECLGRTRFMLVMDDDELPQEGWLEAALNALNDEAADCVGGRIEVSFDADTRPGWLGDDILGFLGQVDHGSAPLWVSSRSTSIWSGNVGYKTSLFKDGLRFDMRYSRVGQAIGGGEDVVMFDTLLARGARMRYCPDMVVAHFVEPWRLSRRYFLRLHFTSGFKSGLHELPPTPRSLVGAPLYLFPQAARQCAKAAAMWLTRNPGTLRQAMNATHAMGLIAGSIARKHRAPA